MTVSELVLKPDQSNQHLSANVIKPMIVAANGSKSSLIGCELFL